MNSSTIQDAPEVSKLDRWFGITERGSSVGREVRGGLVTFFAMAYIIALNPLIIGTSPDINGNLVSGLPYLDAAGEVIVANVGATLAMVAAATALVAGVLTILMGVVGRFPIGIAAGLGLNAMLAYTVVREATWAQAMGLVVWEGILITLLVMTGFREAVFKAVPAPMRSAISVGIGLFIALVGLVNAHVVTGGGGTVLSLGTGGSLLGWPVAIFLIGLLLLIVLHARKVQGAMLISIISTTVLAVVIESVLKIGAFDAETNGFGWALNVPALPQGGLLVLPDLSLIGRVDMFGAFMTGPTGFISMLMTVFALLLADFFDTMGTVVAVGKTGDLLDDEGNPPNIREILMVDSVAAIAGGLGSVSSNTSFVEANAGVGEGARTGLASVVTGIAFLLSMFLSPLVNMVPSEAVAPALVFVGFLMAADVLDIKWTDPEEGLPAFLGVIMMPFAYSITAGIGVAFITFVLLKVVRGKLQEIHPLMWVVAASFIVYFSQGLISLAIAG